MTPSPLDPVPPAALQQAQQQIRQQQLTPVALIALADGWMKLRAFDAIVELYRSWLSHCQSPINYIVQFNLGVALSSLNRLADAEQAYRAAIMQKPDFAQAWFNLGTMLERLARPQEALRVWQSILDERLTDTPELASLHSLVLNNQGRLLEELRQFDAAEAKLLASLSQNPAQPDVVQHWVHLRQKQCIWPTYVELPGLSMGDLLKYTSPLAMLSASDDPGLQLAAAVRFVRERVDFRQPVLAPASGYGHRKLRLGFLSSDFCLHAVSLLTVELFELLDRTQFELYGFCWTREDGSALRARVKQAFDQFIPIAHLDDGAAAQLIRQHEIDVLIDLHGLTAGARPNIVAQRPAPVQMTYLGFPGTTGLPGIDYVIADRYLIPEREKPFYSETPLYLPKVFQCSDRQRPVGAIPSRAQCQLPEQTFVFCCFNNNYKFTETVFASWMAILQQVPDSLLWLLADNPWAQSQMLRQAERYQIAPERLVFGGRLAPADYLARYRQADLFLDAYPFNAGTTANDALWMGLPVLTRSGRTFASRMAGSLLTALDLPELICESQAEYQQKAVALATERSRLHAIRQHLESARQASPLFDMPGFVKDFEQAIRSVARPEA